MGPVNPSSHMASSLNGFTLLKALSNVNVPCGSPEEAPWEYCTFYSSVPVPDSPVPVIPCREWKGWEATASTESQNTKKRMKSETRPIQRWLLCLLFAPAAVGWAQSEPGSTSALDEDVYTLSPFEVATDSSMGYLATSTLAGTRLRTDLRDVGSAISVVTKEFLEDVGATGSSTLLQYTTNAEVSGTRGTYGGLGTGTSLNEEGMLRAPGGAQRVRGLASADNTRDFYITDIPWDSYITDRIDIQRGPNALLFGLGSPAGIVNAALDTAQFYDTGEVKLSIGSYGSMRGSFDINRQVIKDVLAIRVEGLSDREKFKQDPAFENDNRGYVALRFEPKLLDPTKFRTSIRVNYEHGEIRANRPRILPPYDSITAWFRDSADTYGSWTVDSGMGKNVVTNPYDANNDRFATYPTSGAGASSYGINIRNAANNNYQPWISGVVNQQQPLFFMDGASGEITGATAGYINVGARWPNNTIRGPSDGIFGKQYAEQFYRLTSYDGFARSANLPLYGSGQYRSKVLIDPGVFDFYNQLIDGPNKSEWEDWDAYNVTLTQTGWADRVGVELAFDKQEYKRGGFSFLGGSPALTMDIMMNGLDYYTFSNANGVTSQTNPNFGRPYVISDAGGRGSSYTSDREYYRASVYGEFRPEDVTGNDLLLRIFGNQRLNAAFNQEKYFFENRGWRGVANDRTWAGYWNDTEGNRSPYGDRPPVAAIYLGSSIANLDSASDADIPNIADKLAFENYNVRLFDSNWSRYDVNPGDLWTVPSSMSRIYPRDANGNAPDWGTRPPAGYTGTEASDRYFTQASNPANYNGWQGYPLQMLHNDDRGENENLLDSASQTYRETTSQVLAYQGYFWNNAVVLTGGWRSDKVKTKDARALPVPANRSMLDLNTYELPDEFPESQVFEDESLSYGAVLHLNQLFGDRDPLPFNISASFNKSSNFSVVPVRRNLYGATIGNPSGKTKDIGLTLATRDNKYSLRVVKYKTELNDANSTLSDAGGIGGMISNGLNWRNVYLYDLSAYDWAGRESPSYRNTWTNPYPVAGYDDMTPDQQAAADASAQLVEDAAIRGWNEIQAWLTDKGFFQAWGFNPVPLQYLTDRSTYQATLTDLPGGQPVPASQYIPPQDNLYAYGASAPQGFAVTSDTISEGYELELTANPFPGLRLTFNASRTEAVQNNVGGAELAEYVEYMDSKLSDGAGNATPAGLLARWGGAGNAMYNSIWAPWRANYVQLKLNEGASSPEVRKYRYNAIANYIIQDGKFKDLGFGASYRWQDKVAIGYPVRQTAVGFEFDIDNPTYGPTEGSLDLWVSYKRPLTDKINWSVQLNVRNVGDGEGLIPISIQPDGSYAAMRIAPTQEWFITNTFTF
jgi:outer membrane receptor protein involved in Fe transport